MIHLRRINDHTAADGRTSAAEPGSGPAGNDGDVILVQNFAGFGNILRRPRLNYSVRHTETGRYHLIMGIVFGELIPAQDASGEGGSELCKYFRGKRLKRHDILLITDFSSSHEDVILYFCQIS